MRNVDELLSLACYARDRVNPYLFNYSLSVALLHRADTKNLDLPSLFSSFPDKFIGSDIFVRATEIANVLPEGSRVSVIIVNIFTGLLLAHLSETENHGTSFFFRIC